MIRPWLGVLVAASLCLVGTSGCATAVIPDGGGGNLEGAGNGDDAGSTGASSYGGDNGGSSGGSTTDGGTSAKDSGSVSSGGCPTFTGVLATFDFTGEPGDQSSTSPSTAVPGIGAGNVTRSSTVTAATGADSINSTGWGTGSSASTSKYYTFTLTPDAACSLDITSISVDSKSSSTGPTKGSVATSDDSFGAKTVFTPGSPGSVSASVTGASGALEIRVYGYEASSAGGTFRVQNTLSVTGALH